MKFVFAISSLLLAWPLSVAAEENLVLKLEQYLAALGFNPGAVDGAVDEATNEAIRSYQTSRGLPVTGGMTLAEFQALEREALAAASATPQTLTQNTASAGGIGQLSISTTQTPGGSIYHRLSGCQAQTGSAIFFYHNRTQSNQEMSDICFDPENGWVAGSETLTGLTFVSQQDSMAVYEVLSSGVQDFERHAVTISGSNDDNGWVQNIGIRTTHKFATARRPGDQMHGGGILYGPPFPLSSVRGPQAIYFELSAYLPGTDPTVCRHPDPPNVTGEPRYVALQGVFDPQRSNTVQLTSAEGTTEKSQGTLTLTVSETGAVSGTASIYFENPRVAGHATCEWLRSQVELDVIVGHLSGNKHPEIRAQGIGKGRYTDVHGGTYELLAWANVSAYPQRLTE